MKNDVNWYTLHNRMLMTRLNVEDCEGRHQRGMKPHQDLKSPSSSTFQNQKKLIVSRFQKYWNSMNSCSLECDDRKTVRL